MYELKRLERKHLKKAFYARNKWKHYFRQIDDITVEEHLQWFETTIDLMYAIMNDNDYIGVCGLTNNNTKDSNTELSFYFFDDYVNADSSSVIDLLLRKAFKSFNLNSAYCEIYGNDHKKDKLLQEYGFKLDGTLRDRYYHNGRYYNSNIYSITREEWNK